MCLYLYIYIYIYIYYSNYIYVYDVPTVRDRQTDRQTDRQRQTDRYLAHAPRTSPPLKPTLCTLKTYITLRRHHGRLHLQCPKLPA